MSSNFVLEANKLKNIEINLERTGNVLLENLKKHGITNIVDFCEYLEAERKKETTIIQTETVNIINPITKFKHLTLTKNITNLDYKEVKKEMVLVSESMKYFSQKIKQCLEKFKKQEKTCDDDVKVYETKITDWEKPVNLAQSTLDRINNSDKIQQNVTDFLTFLTRSGGHTNGWSSDDHNVFLKARSKCKDINDLCKQLHKILPDITEDAIESHEKWYIKYLKLKQKHKEAIKTWRNAKSAVVTHKPPTKDKERRSTSAYTRVKMNRQEIQVKLEKWKQEKIERLENEKILRDEMEKRRKEIEQKRKQKQEDMKIIIENWKIEKLEKVEKELYTKHTMEKEQRLFKSAMANRLIKEFQSQDEIFIKRRIESCKPKSKSVERVSNNINVVRDPTRLLKPTKQWISRIKSNEDNYKVTSNNSASIKGIQRLGVPQWRKTISITR